MCQQAKKNAPKKKSKKMCKHFHFRKSKKDLFVFFFFRTLNLLQPCPWAFEPVCMWPKPPPAHLARFRVEFEESVGENSQRRHQNCVLAIFFAIMSYVYKKSCQSKKYNFLLFFFSKVRKPTVQTPAQFSFFRLKVVHIGLFSRPL